MTLPRVWVHMYALVGWFFYLSDVELESQSMFGDSETVTVDQSSSTSPQHTLWVDKYAPRHYTHLLSDDVSYTQVLVA